MAEQATPHGLRASALRFLVAGGLNTLVTGALLAALSLVIDPHVAYTLVFFAGIAFSTWMARRFVYGVPLGKGATAAYVLMYLVVYGVGLGAIALAERAGLPEGGTGLVVLVTAPLTFLGGRVIAARQHRRTQALGAAAERSTS